MNTLIVIGLLALLPLCSSITCYSCTGCGDPFSTSTYSSYTSTGNVVCYKTTASGSAVARGGSSVSGSCVASNILGYGTYCCSTDYCNGARSINFQASILIGLGLVALIAKYRFL